jgi:copper transport protein
MIARLVTVLGLMLTLGVLSAPPASAHVEILSTAPAEGTRLSAVPTEVTVRLSENIGVQRDSIHITDQRGARVDDGAVFQPGAEAEVLAVRLKPGLGDGSYLVGYAFVSADSHPIRGSFAFVVGNGPLITGAGSVSGSTGTDGVVHALYTAIRWASFVGVALLGGVVFLLYCRPGAISDRRARAVVIAGCAVLSVPALAGVFLTGPYVAGLGLSEVGSADLLEATLQRSFGKLLILRAVAAAVLAFLTFRLLGGGRPLPEQRRGTYENLTLVAGFLVLLSFSAAGHAITDPIPYFSLIADLLHLGAIAVWLGGLIQLTLCLWRPADRNDTAGEDTDEVMIRFSRLAPVCVVVIVVSGAYLTWRSLPSVSALWSSTYGLLLLAKLTGFAALLGVANISRTGVRRMLANRAAARAVIMGVPGGTVSTTVLTGTDLRKAVAIEVAIAAIVLVLAAILSATAPTQ